ncbi:MAG: hypothetical protein KDK39_14835 [Leptospiraceae bacterium]|nr:hypothetical protein [Leptospiraceae bacterium]
MITIGNFIFRWRDTLFTLILLSAFPVVIYTNCPGIESFLPVQQALGDWIMGIAGLVLLVSGFGVRIITIGYAYIKRGGLNKQIYAESVVRRGMFAHCRNPMYLGNLLIVTGGIVAFNMLYFFPVLLLFYFFYACIIVAEEHFLGQRFGADYADYLKTVPRLLPNKLSQWKTSIEGMDFTWKRVLKKEHGSIAVVMGSLVVFTAMKLVFRYQLSWNDPAVYATWAVLAGLLLVYFLLEGLKRSSRLEWDPNRP